MKLSGRLFSFTAAAALASAGMLAAQSPVAPAGSTQLPSSTGQTMPGLVHPPIYRMSGVVNSMNLTADQVRRLNEAESRLQSRYSRQFQGLERMNASDRTAREQQLLNSYTNDWNTAAGGILNQNQLGRYRQLELQYGGINALMTPTVQQQLNLTQTQMDQLRQDQQWSQQQLQAVQRQSLSSPDMATRLYQQFLRDRDQRIKKALSPEQQRQWNTLTGEPFQFESPFGTRR